MDGSNYDGGNRNSSGGINVLSRRANVHDEYVVVADGVERSIVPSAACPKSDLADF
jgi:hypothetical protein